MWSYITLQSSPWSPRCKVPWAQGAGICAFLSSPDIGLVLPENSLDVMADTIWTKQPQKRSRRNPAQLQPNESGQAYTPQSVLKIHTITVYLHRKQTYEHCETSLNAINGWMQYRECFGERHLPLTLQLPPAPVWTAQPHILVSLPPLLAAAISAGTGAVPHHGAVPQHVGNRFLFTGAVNIFCSDNGKIMSIQRPL